MPLAAYPSQRKSVFGAQRHSAMHEYIDHYEGLERNDDVDRVRLLMDSIA